MSVFADFNKEQILDLVNDMKTCQSTLASFITSLGVYKDELVTIRTQISELNDVTPSIKASIDQNVQLLMTDVTNELNTIILVRNVGLKNMDILDRLSKGILYSYKLNNGTMVVGTEIVKFDSLRVDETNRIFIIGENTNTTEDFQVSLSRDYEPTPGSLSGSSGSSSVTVLDSYLDGMLAEISKTGNISAYIDIINKSIDFIVQSIRLDVQTYNLFDVTLLN
jgi:hypothetical protein